MSCPSCILYSRSVVGCDAHIAPQTSWDIPWHCCDGVTVRYIVGFVLCFGVGELPSPRNRQCRVEICRTNFLESRKIRSDNGGRRYFFD